MLKFSKREVEMLLHGLNCARVNFTGSKKLEERSADKLKVLFEAKAKLEVALRNDYP